MDLTSTAKNRVPNYRDLVYRGPATHSITRITAPVPDIAPEKVIDTQPENDLNKLAKDNLGPKPVPLSKAANRQELMELEKEKRKYELRKQIMIRLHAMSMPTYRFVSKFCAKIGKTGQDYESRFIGVYPQHFLDSIRIQESQDAGRKIEFSNILQSLAKLADVSEAQLYTTLFNILQDIRSMGEDFPENQKEAARKLAQSFITGRKDRQQTDLILQWMEELTISNDTSNLTLSDLYGKDDLEFQYLLMKPDFKELINNTRDDINIQCRKDFTTSELMFTEGIDSKFAELMAVCYEGVLAGKVSMSGGNGGAYRNTRTPASSFEVNFSRPTPVPTRYNIMMSDREYLGLIIFFSNVYRSDDVRKPLIYIPPVQESRDARPLLIRNSSLGSVTFN